MGRAKLSMELISKEKSRNVTYKKRKEGLMRKMKEFTTLCDVKACMIMYGPNQANGAGAVDQPDIWPPENVDEVHRLVAFYKSKTMDSSTKTFGLCDFLQERKKRVEEEIAKLRKKKVQSAYPAWMDFMDYLSESELRQFAAGLMSKIEIVNAKIEEMKRNEFGFLLEGPAPGFQMGDQPHARLSQFQDYYAHGGVGLVQRGIIELEVINQQQVVSALKPIHEMHVPMIQYQYSADVNNINDHQQDHHHRMQMINSVNPDSMMMMLMNNDTDYSQLGSGAPPSNDVQCAAAASFKRQKVYYESTTTGVVDNMMYDPPKPLARYYDPTMHIQAVSPPYVMLPAAAAGVAPTQFHSSSSWDCEFDDNSQCQMKDQNARYY